MMKLVLATALVLPVFVLGTASNAAALPQDALNHPPHNHGVVPRTYYVAPPPIGNDLNPGTSADQPWATPQRAANTVIAGDTVLVNPGTYTSYGGSKSVLRCPRGGTVENPILFRANGPRGQVIFDNGDLDEVIQVSSHTIVDGFDMRNALAGIRADTADGVIVRNCEIQWKGTAILVKPYGKSDHGSAGILIENNV